MKGEKKEANIAFRKPFFPIKDELAKYLERHNRVTASPLLYDDLLHFRDYTSIEDKEGNDTLWLSVYYSEWEHKEIQANLNKIYTLLHSDGDEDTLPYLTVDSIEFCTFGNSKPFRIRVRNILNDNYTNYYIKKADASRIYGLELEDIFSYYRINYMVYKDTLIEEHILGIPGDSFIKNYLPHCSEHEKAQIAKEFVKFNERCMVGLLGDMRSYNYVVVVTHDYDQIVYRIRAIDFDQQCYEGDLKVYLPQYFKENYPMVKLVTDKLKPNSIEQYKKEMRSLIAKQLINNHERYLDLMNVIRKDDIAPQENIVHLRTQLQKLTYNSRFKNCQTMGDVVETGLEFVLKNYKK